MQLKKIHLLCVFITLIFSSCLNSSKDKYSKECKSKSIGTYIFSKELSKVDLSKEAISLTNLRLKVREDNSFELSKKIPHLNDSIGTWEVINEWKIEGQYPYINLNFSNGITKQISCCCDDNNRIAINCPYELSSKLPKKYGFLSFVKIE